MLDDLQAYLVEATEHDDPFVRMDAFELRGDEAVARLSVLNSYADQSWSRWQVSARGLIDYAVRNASGELSLHGSDHVVIRQHTSEQQGLAFRGAPPSAVATIGQLVQRHWRETEGWIPFDRYFNAQVDLEALLSGGFGQLASGPDFLIRAYADVLEQGGMTPNLLAARSPTRWDGRQFREIPSRLVMFVVGEAYIVAESFQDSRLAEDAV